MNRLDFADGSYKQPDLYDKSDEATASLRASRTEKNTRATCLLNLFRLVEMLSQIKVSPSECSSTVALLEEEIFFLLCEKEAYLE